MNLDLQKRWAKRWEGVRRRVYRDTKGIPTIGVGCNMTTQWAKDSLPLAGINYEEALVGSLSLTDVEIDKLLDLQLTVAAAEANQLLPDLYTYPEPQQVVIIDLSFNMGKSVLSKFTHTLQFIREQNWSEAATNLTFSSWYIEVKERGIANVAVLGNKKAVEAFL